MIAFFVRSGPQPRQRTHALIVLWRSMVALAREVCMLMRVSILNLLITQIEDLFEAIVLLLIFQGISTFVTK
jgi:hypothetical protein